ncbi:MAG: hypothetical protein HYY16_13165 [Planctomycetes bacterium]|nr:hypothetical protein [Planctomycetota bacterium]
MPPDGAPASPDVRHAAASSRPRFRHRSIRKAAPSEKSTELRSDVLIVLLASIPLLASTFLLMLEAVTEYPMIILACTCVVANGLAIWRCHSQLGRSSELGALVFHMGVFSWMYLPGLLTALSDKQWHLQAALIWISNRDGLMSYEAINLFYLVFTIVYQIKLRPGLVNRVAAMLGKGTWFPTQGLLIALLVLSTAAVSFYVLSSGGLRQAVDLVLASRTQEKPWSMSGNYGTSLSPMHVVAQAAMVVVSILSWHLLLTVRIDLARRLLLAGMFLGSTGWVSAEGGTRSVLILATLPPMLVFYRFLIHRKGPSRYLRYALIAAIVPVLATSMSYQRRFRYGEREGERFSVEDVDHLTSTAYAIAISEREGRYIKDSVLLNILAGPIPRVLWPKSKPELESIVVYTKHVWGIDIKFEGGNATPGIVGQYFLSWRWFGVLEVAVALALLIRLGDCAFASAPGWFLSIGHATLVTYVLVSFRAIGFSFFNVILLLLPLIWILRMVGKAILSARQGGHRPLAPATR